MSAVTNVETVLSSGIRLTVPLAFAALGEYLAERAGTMNISIEAMMLGGAFTSIAVASGTGSATVGLVAGTLIGLVVGVVHGTLSHRAEINTFVVGLTLNMLVLGLTSYFIATHTYASHQVGQLKIPGLRDIPIIGPPLFVQRWPAYLLLALVPLTWWLVERSRWGLELRAVGENPQAADVTGIHVNRRKRQALMWCGLLSGLGGAYLAIGEVGSFNQNMTAGRGYLVIAAVIFGGWRLTRTLIGCGIFGLAGAGSLALPTVGVHLNDQFLQAAPYVLALVTMLVFSTQQREPRALGRPFERGST